MSPTKDEGMAKAEGKAPGRKIDIIKTARHLFQTKEYEKTTMQDIMAALDIAKGTIYHYFKSKEELLEAVIEDIVDENIEQMQGVLKEAKGNALQKMKSLVRAGKVAEENKNLLEYLHKPGNSAMHTRLLGAILLKQAPLYAELIQQGCKEGTFKTESPLECAEFFLSAVQFLTDIGIYPWSQQDLSRRAKSFPQLIEQLLQAPKGSFQFLIEQVKPTYHC